MATDLIIHKLFITSILASASVTCIVAGFTWRVTFADTAGLFLTPNLKALVHVTWWLLAKL